MGIRVREKRGKLYLDLYVGGRRTWESLGLSVGADKAADKEAWRLAELVRARREQQVMSGEWQVTDRLGGKQRIAEYAARVAERYGAKHPLTLSVAYLREYAGEAQVGQIDERFVEGYRDFLLATKLSQTTASNYFAAFKAIMKRAARDRLVIRNAALGVRGIGVPDSNKPLLASEDVRRLARAIPHGDLGAQVKAAFMLACQTGLRVSDLVRLTWGEVSRESRFPELRRVQEKTHTLVVVPLNEQAQAILFDERKPQLHRRDERVFPLLSSRKNLNDELCRWARTAGLDRRLGFHDARRYFATSALSGGADVITVSRLLGHRKLSQVLAYAKTSDAQRRAAVEGLPTIDTNRRKA